VLPFVVGIPYGVPPPETAAPVRSTATTVGVAPAAQSSREPDSFLLAAPASGQSIAAPLSGVDDPTSFEIDVLAPVKMLFTVRRGLFVWTPLTFFGVLGLLWVRGQTGSNRGGDFQEVVDAIRHLGRRLRQRRPAVSRLGLRKESA
jgi:hypothetical protein